MEAFNTLRPEFLVVGFLLFFVSVHAQISIPSKQEGFWYTDRAAGIDSILIEAFLDPVCPDSRDAWLPLKQAVEHYGSRVSLVVYPFALPYVLILSCLFEEFVLYYNLYLILLEAQGKQKDMFFKFWVIGSKMVGLISQSCCCCFFFFWIEMPNILVYCGGNWTIETL